MPTWTLPCLAEGWFASPEAAKAAVNAFASRSGYAVVTKTTRYDKHKQARRVVLACDRHGLHLPTTTNARRTGSSRKCGCPMELNVVRAAVGTGDRWQLQHRGTANEHSHPPSEGPETHPELRKASWNAQARQIVLEDARAGTPVKQTLARLAVETPGVMATKADLYNERRRLLAAAVAQGGSAGHSTEDVLQGQVAGTSWQVAAPVDTQPGYGAAVMTAGPDGASAATGCLLQGASAQRSSPDEARTDQVAVPDASIGQPWDLPCLPESSFDSPEAARAAVNAFASRSGYAVVHRSTRYDKNQQPRRIILACDRHGTNRQRPEATTATAVTAHRRSKPSRKCDCPMRVNLVRLKADGDVLRWHVQHRGLAREHNHPPSTGPSMHPILRRESRTEAARGIIAADIQTGVPVSHTLARLAAEAPGVILTARDVYNQRRVLAESSNAPSTQPTQEAPAASQAGVGAESFSGPRSNAATYPQSQYPANSPRSAPASLVLELPPSPGIEAEEEDRQQLTGPMPSSEDQPQRTWYLPCLAESSFASPDAARSAVNAFAGRYGYAVVHRSTRYDKNKQPRRIILACDRHGAKRPSAKPAAGASSTQRRGKPSRKCGCPMRVNLMRIGTGQAERWQVQHRGIATGHNHAPSSGAANHPILRRESLTEAARQIIAFDARAGIPVAQTLARMAVEAPGALLTARDVYNQRHAMVAHAAEA
jgi:hypothetical protein